MLIGWGTRIRTSVDGVRVRSPAARRSPICVSVFRVRYAENSIVHGVNKLKYNPFPSLVDVISVMKN